MAFKNSLKIYLKKKEFFSFAGRRLASGPPAEAGPARQRSPGPLQPTSPRPSPARWLLLPRAAPRTRQDALAAWRPCVGVARRAAATTCARAHAPAFNCHSQCARSLPPALPSLSSRAESPKLCPSPRPRTRRRNSPRLLHLGRKSRARSSASPSFKSRSRLRHLPSSG